jgi:hypothetical protein
MTKEEVKRLKEDLTIPNEIKNQLFSLDMNAVMCWASNNFRGSGPVDPEHNGQLIFNIQNLRNIKKGYIKINLNYADTYDIFIYNGKDLYADFKGIYCDQLIDVIGDCIGY